MGFFHKLKKLITASTGTKIATVAIVLVLLAGSIAGIVYAAVANRPEFVVGKAFVKTFASEEDTAEEVFGINTLLKLLETRGTEWGVEAKVKDIPLDVGFDTFTIPNASVGVVFRDNPEGERNVDLEVKVAGTSLLKGKVYVDATQVQVNLPKLMDSTLAVNYGSETFKEDLKDSYLVDYFGISQNMLDWIPDHSEKQSEEPGKNSEQENLLLTCLKNNFSEVKLEKAKDTLLPVGTENIKCQLYTMMLARGDVSGFLYEYSLGVKNYVKEVAAGYHLDETEVEYIFQNADKVIREIRGAISDVPVKIYIYKGRVVKVTMDWEMNWLLEQPTKGGLEWNFATEGNPTENMQFVLILPLHRDAALKDVPQCVEIHYNVVTENTEDGYTVTVEAVYNGKPVSISFDYNKSEGDFTCQTAYGTTVLELNGVFNQVEKGKKLSFEIEEYKCTQDELIEEQEIEIKVYLQVPETKVFPLDDKPSDILKMEQEDFEAIGNEIKENLYKKVFGMLGLFS